MATVAQRISYKSFCFVIGTTSFRAKKLNMMIEQQLRLLQSLYEEITETSEWVWDSSLQERYYDLMKREGFLTGTAARKDKDAREKTSGLVEIGLLTKDRRITEAGRALLEIVGEGTYQDSNIFQIKKDSYLYLRQLLKTSCAVDAARVRPFLVTVRCLLELEKLTYDEFCYFVQMMCDEKSAEELIESIRSYRKGEKTVDEVIYDHLMRMENYQQASKLFSEAPKVTEELIGQIGMNRKSGKYDKAYFPLYRCLKRVFLEQADSCEELLEVTKGLKQAGILWRDLLFQTTSKQSVRKGGREVLRADSPFLSCENEASLQEVFFRYLHVFKAKLTLKDYFDLNRRYLSLSDAIVFEDGTLTLDLVPKYFFQEVMKGLAGDTFTASDKLMADTSLSEISPVLAVRPEDIYAKLSRDIGIDIENAEQAQIYVEAERSRRFNELIDKKFSDATLSELLACFEKREDARIERLVTDEATIPTIFEYILGIIWYKVSERQGNILDFMNLSLEANLLPKTHAAGGDADIVYKYDSCADYPKHALLIEATLADGSNQRRMEMEPVSRHLGDYRIRSDNPFDYSLFISTYLDKNVVSDFRYRKIIPYTKDGKTITGMKILSMDTKTLQKIVENKVRYRTLYKTFEKYYSMPLEADAWQDGRVKDGYPVTVKWQDNMVNEAVSSYAIETDSFLSKEKQAVLAESIAELDAGTGQEWALIED